LALSFDQSQGRSVAPSVAWGVEPRCPDELSGVLVEFDVDQQDAWPEAAREPEGLIAARGLADHLNAVLVFQQRCDPAQTSRCAWTMTTRIVQGANRS
jgi:hypothetical protein